MHRFKLILLVTLMGILFLAGCGSNLSTPDQEKPASVSPSILDAEDVAGRFLAAWEVSDYATMHSLLSDFSQTVYDRETFEQHYATFSEQLRLTSIETQMVASSRQGTTVAISYAVTFHSEIFGEIVDSGRTLRLIETPTEWQIHWSTTDILPEMAEGTRLQLRHEMPVRGNIYDRNGDLLVEQNGRSILLYMTKEGISDYGVCLDVLSEFLRRERSALETQMEQFLPDTVFLLDEIAVDTYQTRAQQLADLCGIGKNDELSTRTNRLYLGDLAPHVTGFVGPIPKERLETYETQGYPADAVVGLDGIEAAYEQQLTGVIGRELVLVAPTGEVMRVLADTPSRPGQNVYLTIDRDLQASVQQALVEAYDLAQPTWASQSPGAAAIVMDVRTGEILAMSSFPWFDPEQFNPSSLSGQSGNNGASFSNDPRKPLLNRATQGLYPPGSVFKIISMAAGLDTGVFSTDTTVECTNRWYGQQYGDVLEYRTDWYLPGRGFIDFSQALTYSCNPYFWQLGVALHNTDPSILAQYARWMGLGVPTGQEVLSEATGVVPGPDSVTTVGSSTWELADTLNLVIGQGQIQVTPLQITRMVAAFSNGGQLFTPQFVKRVESRGGDLVSVSEPAISTTLDLSPETLRTIRQAMCNVTLDSEGTARFIFEDWYEFQGNAPIVCGKTGTAQSGDMSAPPHAWFAAFTPNDLPEIAVVVVVEQSCEGSEVAAPIVRRIVEDYFGLPHSEWPPLWQTSCTSLGE